MPYQPDEAVAPAGRAELGQSCDGAGVPAQPLRDRLLRQHRDCGAGQAAGNRCASRCSVTKSRRHTAAASGAMQLADEAFVVVVNGPV